MLSQSLLILRNCPFTNGLLKKYKRPYNAMYSNTNYRQHVPIMTNMPFESTANKLVVKSYQKPDTPMNKVTVVGTGEVAAASTFALLAQDVTSDVCMIGVDDNKLRGEEMDLKYGSMFFNNPKIIASKDHAASAGSNICVLALAIEQGLDESKVNFTTRNSMIVRAIIPQLLKYSPDAVYLIASDPVDVLTYQAWRAGDLRKTHVLGTGNSINSARFRYMIASRLGVDSESCDGIVIGRNPFIEEGGGVPVWSEASACGVRLMELNPQIGTKFDPEHWEQCYNKLMKDEQVIRRVKGGYTWSLALAVTDICAAILTNAHCVRPVSTYAKGEYSIAGDVFISLPCVLAQNGIVNIVRQPLTASELTLLRRDALAFAETQKLLKILQ